VLARIAELNRSDEQQAASAPASSAANYRVDAPHSYATSPSHAAPLPEAKPLHRPGTSHPVPSERPHVPDTTTHKPQTKPRAVQSVPLPLRAAVETWQVVQPHRALIRFAATLALMVAGGMSMALIMRQRIEPASGPAGAITTVSETPAATNDTQHVELQLQPSLEPVVAPDTDTSSLEPTATGPLTPASKPVMAVESGKASESSEPTAPVLPYPVTSFAEAPLPPLPADALPQVRTSDPEVARLRGDVLPTQTR